MKFEDVTADTLTDEEIVSRVVAGEKGLYEIIMRRHNERLFRISRAYGNDADGAEDIVQQAYMNAYEHLPGFQGRSRFSTWLTRIVINEAIGRNKRRNRSLSLEGVFSGDGSEHTQHQGGAQEGPEESVMNDELRSVLERTIDGLPVKYRSVFVMREIEEMSIAETSESLGITQVNVKVRLNRAKEMLRRRLGTLYQDAGVYHFDLVRCDRIVRNVLSRIARYRPGEDVGRHAARRPTFVA